LDKQAAEEVNKILVKEKRVSQKRKEYERKFLFLTLQSMGVKCNITKCNWTLVVL
jgi:hypothetical protein